MKPLLEVTKQEEKLTQKEDELRQIRERLETQAKRSQELEQKYQQATAEKTQLAEQLQVSILIRYFSASTSTKEGLLLIN